MNTTAGAFMTTGTHNHITQNSGYLIVRPGTYGPPAFGRQRAAAVPKERVHELRLFLVFARMQFSRIRSKFILFPVGMQRRKKQTGILKQRIQHEKRRDTKQAIGNRQRTGYCAFAESLPSPPRRRRKSKTKWCRLCRTIWRRKAAFSVLKAHRAATQHQQLFRDKNGQHRDQDRVFHRQTHRHGPPVSVYPPTGPTFCQVLSPD